MKRSIGKKFAVWLTAAALAVTGNVTAWASVRLDTVSDVYWDDDNDTVAVWEEVEDAYQYEIYLYLDDSKVTSVKTKKTKYNFEKKLTKEGEYTFRVRALAKSSDRDYRDSAWSDYSDGLYISADYAELMKNGGKIDTEYSGPGAKENTSGETAAASDNSVVYKEEWVQDTTGWRYRRTDGTYLSNCWFQDMTAGKWYFFNEAGYMATGWIDWEGQKYYCEAAGDAAGVMVTGEITIEGVPYVFDASGVLISGQPPVTKEASAESEAAPAEQESSASETSEQEAASAEQETAAAETIAAESEAVDDFIMSE